MESLPKSEELKLDFRRATPDDVGDFLEMEKTAIKHKTYSGITDQETALQEIAKKEVYMIYHEGKLAGSTEFQTISPDHAHLSGLVIHPDFQGKGIARQAALFRLEKLKNVKRVDLVTHPENFKIINLYQSLGFKVEKRIENYFGDGEPRLMLVKEKKFRLCCD